VTIYRVSFKGPSALTLRVATALADANGVELISSDQPLNVADGKVALNVAVEGAFDAVADAVAKIRGDLPSDAQSRSLAPDRTHRPAAVKSWQRARRPAGLCNVDSSSSGMSTPHSDERRATTSMTASESMSSSSNVSSGDVARRAAASSTPTASRALARTVLRAASGMAQLLG
jgi:hypothetical protein